MIIYRRYTLQPILMYIVITMCRGVGIDCYYVTAWIYYNKVNTFIGIEAAIRDRCNYLFVMILTMLLRRRSPRNSYKL